MEAKGKIISISELISLGKIEKKECVIETFGEYPKLICIDFFGLKASELDMYSIDDRVTISINISSREYNGKWYTNVNGYKIKVDVN